MRHHWFRKANVANPKDKNRTNIIRLKSMAHLTLTHTHTRFRNIHEDQVFWSSKTAAKQSGFEGARRRIQICSSSSVLKTLLSRWRHYTDLCVFVSWCVCGSVCIFELLKSQVPAVRLCFGELLHPRDYIASHECQAQNWQNEKYCRQCARIFVL